MSSSVTDPNPANNSVTDTDTLTPSADLSITKADGVTNVTAGGSTTYTITATNIGPSDAPSSDVSDAFTASLTGCTWTCAGAGGGTCNAAGSGDLTTEPADLPVGGSVTFTVSCGISTGATGTIVNTATVGNCGLRTNGCTAIPDPNQGNNSATDNDFIDAVADLAITKTDGVTAVTAGGATTYTIVASNAGPSDVNNLTVDDAFPVSLTCSWTCASAGGAFCAAAGAGNINDTSVNLPVGGTVTYTASCTISGSATGSVVNTATVASCANRVAGCTAAADPNPANNSATDTDTVGVQADLAITKTDGVTSVTAGGSTTSTITATNAGPSAAGGATVADTFPASLTCNWTCTGAGGGTCTAAGSGNINDSVNLPSGGSATYTASCTISGSASGSISNTATVTAPAGVTDPTPGDNSATDVDAVGTAPGANVTGTKTASAGPFNVGGTVTYTVILTNSGTGAQADNPGNEFTDVLPATLALVSATATSGTAVATVGTNTVTWNGSLAPSASVTITITVTILPAAAGTTVNNQGTFVFDGDGNGSNETTGQTDDPAVVGGTNPTPINVTGTPTAVIPTLDEVGFLALLLLLSSAGVVAVRRRGTAGNP